MIFTLILIIHVLVCLVLIVSVLLQRGKGATMGAAFGTGGSQTVFGGSGAGNFLSRVTSICAAIFFSTSLILAYRSTFNRSVVEGADQTAPVPKAAPGPEGAAAPGPPAAAPSETPSKDAPKAAADAPKPGETPKPAASPSGNAPAPIQITIPPRAAAAAPAPSAAPPAAPAPGTAPAPTK
jgi:preprotein translocase subunit SecG